MEPRAFVWKSDLEEDPSVAAPSSFDVPNFVTRECSWYFDHDLGRQVLRPSLSNAGKDGDRSEVWLRDVAELEFVALRDIVEVRKTRVGVRSERRGRCEKKRIRLRREERNTGVARGAKRRSAAIPSRTRFGSSVEDEALRTFCDRFLPHKRLRSSQGEELFFNYKLKKENR